MSSIYRLNFTVIKGKKEPCGFFKYCVTIVETML